MVARWFRTGVKQVSNRISCKEQHRGGLPAVQVDNPANNHFGRWVLPLEPDTNLPVGHRPNTPQFALIVFPIVPWRSQQAARPDGLGEGCAGRCRRLDQDIGKVPSCSPQSCQGDGAILRTGARPGPNQNCPRLFPRSCPGVIPRGLAAHVPD
jgi:hypothetical protein